MNARSDRWKQRGTALAARGTEWFETARARGGLVDLVADLYDRDVDSNASVLGSAIALRLFLFVLPANVALFGLVGVLRLGSFVEQNAESSSPSGSISAALVGLSWWSSLWFFLSGLVLTLMAGRSLAKVLAACAVGAWQMSVRESRVKVMAVVALTGVLFADVAAGLLFTRVRDDAGLPAATVTWLAVMASTSLAWFLVMLALPRKVNDPGALLPGAAVTGVCYTALQWFMQFYLPNRIARTTDTLGELAVTVATLGNFFFIGRIMVSSMVTTAVVYERWGSVSQLVFGLPGVRRIARRSARLRAFFSLDVEVISTEPAD
jgi:uncharacterized BrkB/YihY/UPF0761 family membrane protein